MASDEENMNSEEVSVDRSSGKSFFNNSQYMIDKFVCIIPFFMFPFSELSGGCGCSGF